MATTVTLKPNAIDISGSTSGTTTLQATAVAGTTTLTLPAATDTLVGKATTDTLTNKTLTGAVMNGTLGATTPSTVAATTLTTTGAFTTTGGSNVQTSWTLAEAGSRSLVLKNPTSSLSASVGTGTNHDLQVEGNIVYIQTGSFGARSTAATFDSSGNLLVGTTDANPNSGTGVKINSGTGARTSVVGAADTNANFAFTAYSTGAAAYRFQVGYGGTIYATSTSITAISDASLKTNVRDLETGLTEVLALQPRRFDWINGDASNVAGFIAQEVQQVLPDLIEDYQYNDEEIKLGLKMGDILPTLVKAIQELKAEFDAYKASHP